MKGLKKGDVVRITQAPYKGTTATVVEVPECGKTRGYKLRDKVGCECWREGGELKLVKRKPETAHIVSTKGLVLCYEQQIVSFEVAQSTVLVTVKDEKNKREFTGTAKCSPDDKFDLNVGIDLAYRRAMRKRRKQQRPWKPKPGDTFYTSLVSDGKPGYMELVWPGCGMWKFWMKHGGVFKTKEEAVERSKEILEGKRGK